MTLEEYIRSFCNGSQRAFAALARIDEGQLSKYLRGISKPSVDAASRIEDASGGKVLARSWAKVKIHPSSSPRSPKSLKAASPTVKTQ